MAAPTNIDFNSAIDVGSLASPQVITQDVHDSGTTYTVWYSYTAQTGDTELGAFPWGGGGSYTPDVTFWTSDLDQVLQNNAQNRPSQLPITPGITYGMKIHPNGGNPSPAVLTLTVQLGPKASLAAGLLAINDSSPGYPAVIMDPTSGEPVAFVHPFAAGEGVVVLQSGVVCAIDVDADGIKLYDQNLNFTIAPTMPATGYIDCVGTNQVDTFWVGKHAPATASRMVTVSSAGVVGTPFSVGTVGLKALSPNADNSKVYFTGSFSVVNDPVRVVDTTTFVVTTFKAGVAGKHFGANLMMLTDNTLLVPYEEVGVDTVIRRYNEAGTEQTGSPITLTGVQNALERIFADPSDPTFFWVWWQTSTENRFQKITTATGVVTTNLTWPKFIEGDYQGAAAASPDAYFGADFSCVPWILRGTTTTTTYPIRRQRRGLMPSSPNQRRMKAGTLQVLIRSGIATADFPDPQVRLRISKDGGKTWGPERSRSAGAVGRWADRVRFLRATGNYRNAVFEITVDAAVDWQFLDLIATEGIDEGSS